MNNIHLNGYPFMLGVIILIFCIAIAAVIFWSQRMDPEALAYTFGIMASIPLVTGPIVMYRRYRRNDLGYWKNISDNGVHIFFLTFMAIFLIMTVLAYFKMSFSAYITWVIIFGAVYFVFTLFFIRYSHRLTFMKE